MRGIYLGTRFQKHARRQAIYKAKMTELIQAGVKPEDAKITAKEHVKEKFKKRDKNG